MRIHYITGSIDGCSLVQCYIPAKYLSRLPSVKATVSSRPEFIEDKDLHDADVVILQRQIRNSVFQYMKKHKSDKLFIYDLDDDLWLIPSDFPTKKFWPDRKLKLVEIFVKECKFVTVHSEGVYMNLKERFPDINVYLLPPLVDFERAISKRRPNREEIRVGWQGSSSHVKMAEHVAHAVAQVIRGEPRVRAVWMGFLPTPIKRLPWWQWEYYDWVSIDDFYEVLGALDLDIGLAPLQPSKFSATRTVRKLLDYGMFGIPVIATDTPPFSTHAKDVFYPVDSSNKLNRWRRAIFDMVANERLRQEFSEKILSFAKQFDAKERIAEWLEVYREIQRRAHEEAKKRKSSS